MMDIESGNNRKILGFRPNLSKHRPLGNEKSGTSFTLSNANRGRHQFTGSNKFSVVDLNHAYHQFPLDEESKKLFVFLHLGGYINIKPWPWAFTQQLVSIKKK